MTDLKVDSRALTARGQELRKASAELGELLKKASTLVSDLTKNSWRGEAPAVFSEEFNDWKNNQALVNQSLHTLGEHLIGTGLEFRKLDEDKGAAITEAGPDGLGGPGMPAAPESGASKKRAY